MRFERWLVTLPLKLRSLFRGRQLDREIDDEIRDHLDHKIDDYVAGGLTPEAARFAALRDFGGVTYRKEGLREARGAWGLVWLERLWQDLRYAQRVMRKSPGFTSIAVVSLAIGIGANTAIFTFADSLLLRPLSVPRAADLMTVGLTGSSRVDTLVASYPDYVDIRDRSKSFAGLVPSTSIGAAFAAEPGAESKLRMGLLVGGDFFRVIGVEPELGRDFRPEEDQVQGRDAVVILGHDFWAQQFGADRSVLGRAVRLNGITFTVIGVAPAGLVVDQYFRFQFYAPLMMWPRLMVNPTDRPFENRDLRSLSIAGRLAPGVTMRQAQTELSAVATQLEQEHPDSNRNRRIMVRTELQKRVAQSPAIANMMAMLTLLSGAVLFVACANVAGMLTSRAPVRAREIALRLAIGAGRARVIRQLITESLLMAIAGGVLGLAIGYAAVRLFSQIRVATDLPIVVAFDLDRRALLVSAAVALASVLLFGLAPAIRSTRADLTAVMKGSDGAGHRERRRWGRALLVGGQVAVSVVLLVVATFVYRGFSQQLDSGPGFRTDHLLMMSVTPGQLQYTEAQSQRFLGELVDQARLVPGVTSATLTRYMPMDGGPPSTAVVPEGFQFPPGKDSAAHATSVVGTDYFDTLGLPMIAGRGFRATDSADAPRVAVVNEVFAQRYWPGQDAIGKRIRVGNIRGPWIEIVGVAKTSKYALIIERPIDFVYLPYQQRPVESLFLLVRSAGDPAGLVTSLRDIVRRLDANMPIANVRTMEELYRMRSVDVLNVTATIIAAMGMMGLFLAVIGLYGLVSYAASRRTREIGIRMAIGAGRWDVLRTILREGLVLAVIGLGAGLLLSVPAARALGSVFPGGPGGDGRTDVVAFPLVAVVVLAVTLLAAYLPARRASRINPLEALRHD